MRIRPLLVLALLTFLWTWANAQPTATEKGDGRLFADGPGALWQIRAAEDVRVEASAEAEVFVGSAALGIDVLTDAIRAHIVEFIPSTPVVSEQYLALRFAFHPGTAELIPRSANSRIAFHSFRNERWDIYSVTAAGDSLANLTQSQIILLIFNFSSLLTFRT